MAAPSTDPTPAELEAAGLARPRGRGAMRFWLGFGLGGALVGALGAAALVVALGGALEVLGDLTQVFIDALWGH